MDAEIGKRRPGGKGVAHQGGRRLGQQDLASVPDGRHPGGPVNIQADQAGDGLGRFARVNAHPHPDALPGRPGVNLQGSLHVNDRGQAAAGRGEHGEQPVSLGVHFAAAVRGQARPDERAIVGQHLRVETLPQPSQQGGRALHVGEEKRESLHGHSLRGFASMARGRICGVRTGTSPSHPSFKASSDVDMEFVMGRYAEAFQQSLADPGSFWGEAAREIDWYRAPTEVLDASNPPFYHWFADGVMNTCFNALDRHVRAGRGGQAALIYDSPVTATQRTYTYTELLDEVARFAGVLRGLGVDQGDRVIIYMPMVPEAVIAMLACARIGAVHSVVFGGFAAAELATRIDDAAPKVVVSASAGIEINRIIEYKPILDRAFELALNKPERCVILQRPQAVAELIAGRDLDWSQAAAGAEPADCVPLAATDPLYILYTSGTTAKPKGVVRDNGGHAVALRWSMTNIYDTGPGEVFWAASDVGWVVGHSYIVYAPLLTGCTTVLYEGKPVGTPDAGAFWRVIAEHKVKSMFTAPTAFRAIKKEDPEGKLLQEYDLSGFRCLFLAGERLDPETYRWAGQLLGVPVVDHWWQTETGWAIAADPMGLEPLPTKPGSPTMPMPGYDVRILDVGGAEIEGRPDRGDRGTAAAAAGMPAHLVGGRRAFRQLLHVAAPRLLYHRGRWLPRQRRLPVRDGPHRRRDQRGRPPVVHRADGRGARQPPGRSRMRGHRSGRRPQGPDPARVRGAQGRRQHRSSRRVCRARLLVRDQIGPVAALRRVDVIAVSKTRSGKILRKTMRGIADGRDEPVPSTVEDPAVLDALRPVLTDPS